MTIHGACILVALVCFLLAAFNVKAPVNLVAIGLLAWLASTLVP